MGLIYLIGPRGGAGNHGRKNLVETKEWTEARKNSSVFFKLLLRNHKTTHDWYCYMTGDTNPCVGTAQMACAIIRREIEEKRVVK